MTPRSSRAGVRADSAHTSTVPELLASRELFHNLVQRELRGKFKTTALGWLWSLVNPLAQVVIFTVVVNFIFRVQPAPGANGLQSFPVWILAGIIMWNYFTTAANMGMNALTGNANLVQKAAFPRALLILSSAGAQGVTTLIEVGVLLVVLIAFGVNPLFWLPVVLLAVIPLVMLTVGLALLLSVANVYFRDTSHLMGIVFQLWFYATPIIYPFEHLADAVTNPWLLRLYELNPMVHVVNITRDALYYHVMPTLGSTAYLWVISALTLAVGYVVFRRFEPRLAEEM